MNHKYQCEYGSFAGFSVLLQLSPSEEGEEDGDFSLRGSHSQVDLTQLCQQEDSQEKEEAQSARRHGKDEGEGEPKTCSSHEPTPLPCTETSSMPAAPIRKTSSDNRLQGKRPPRLLISSNNNIAAPLPPTTHGNGNGNARPSPGVKEVDPDSATLGECLDFCKRNLFAEDGYEDHYLDDLAEVPEAMILSRINSKRAMHSYQLGKQLSFHWSTGAGPRIGCVRDYPSELQFRALEEVSLSPRGGRPARFPSPRPGALTPNSIPAAKCGSLMAEGDGVHASLKPRQRSATWTAF